MYQLRNQNIGRVIQKVAACFAVFTFILGSLIFPQPSYAQSLLDLPSPGSMVVRTSSYMPSIINGMNFFPDDPLKFDFVIDIGDDELSGEDFQQESNKLIKYFLTSLTIPKNEMWVNLSPYEKDRVISASFGQTEMGRDLLAQDYLLKQLTSSLMYPEDELGSEFWQRVYAKAQELYGTTEIPMNTFNKVWIVPERADVYVEGTSVFIMNSHLKVLLEEDYAALPVVKGKAESPLGDAALSGIAHGLGDVQNEDLKKVSDVSSKVIKDVIIPEIEREVNEGKTFSNLRQIYHSMILATWYKKHMRKSLLKEVFVDQRKTKGVETADKEINQKIYDQYTKAFEKGVYNFIKEERDSLTQEVIPRRYFSGGVGLGMGDAEIAREIEEVTEPGLMEVRERLAERSRYRRSVQGHFRGLRSSDAAMLDQEDFRSFSSVSQANFAKAAAHKVAQSWRNVLQADTEAEINFVVATGNTMVGFLDELAKIISDDSGIDLSRVNIFHLDEYAGLTAEHSHSFAKYIFDHFISKIPEGMVPIENIHFMADYVARAENPEAGLDEYYEKLNEGEAVNIFMLGVGKTGHLAFNEPPSEGEETESFHKESMRIVKLHEQTLKDNEKDYPQIRINPYGWTMGVKMILEDSDQIFFLAQGEGKAEIVQKSLEADQPISDIPSSYLTIPQIAKKTSVILDASAASKLRREKMGEGIFTDDINVSDRVKKSSIPNNRNIVIFELAKDDADEFIGEFIAEISKESRNNTVERIVIEDSVTADEIADSLEEFGDQVPLIFYPLDVFEEGRPIWAALQAYYQQIEQRVEVIGYDSIKMLRPENLFIPIDSNDVEKVLEAMRAHETQNRRTDYVGMMENMMRAAGLASDQEYAHGFELFYINENGEREEATSEEISQFKLSQEVPIIFSAPHPDDVVIGAAGLVLSALRNMSEGNVGVVELLRGSGFFGVQELTDEDIIKAMFWLKFYLTPESALYEHFQETLDQVRAELLNQSKALQESLEPVYDSFQRALDMTPTGYFQEWAEGDSVSDDVKILIRRVVRRLELEKEGEILSDGESGAVDMEWQDFATGFIPPDSGFQISDELMEFEIEKTKVFLDGFLKKFADKVEADQQKGIDLTIGIPHVLDSHEHHISDSRMKLAAAQRFAQEHGKRVRIVSYLAPWAGGFNAAFHQPRDEGEMKEIPKTLAEARKRATAIVNGELMAKEGFGYDSPTPQEMGGEAAERFRVDVLDDQEQFTSDSAMIAQKEAEAVGGIDLSPDILELHVQGSHQKIETPIHLQYLTSDNVEGFLPVITTILPTTKLFSN